MKYLIITFFLLTGFCPGALEASKYINESYNKNGSEEIKIHTDRFIYLSGETIYFSAYYMENKESSNQITSTVLYVELFDCYKKTISRYKYKIDDGLVSGTLKIPEDVITGNYILRAYTQYMRNNPPEHNSYCYLTIINPIYAKKKHISKTENSIDIVVEKGALISGDSCTVAFKLDEVLKRRAINVYITDQNKNLIAEVKPYKNGLGLSKITPVDSLKYFIKVTLNNGDTIIKPFPENQQNGITPVAVKERAGLYLNIFCNSEFIHKNGHTYNLTFTSHLSETLNESEIYLENKKNKIRLSKENLTIGLNYLTIYNSKREIVCVYAYYNHEQTSQKLDIKTSKKFYNRREKIVVSMLQDNNNIEDFRHLSMSVVKKGTAHASVQTIPEFIISNPNFIPEFLYGIGKPCDQLQQQIDILLILYNNKLRKNKELSVSERTDIQTEGWIPEIKDVTISGIIRDKKTQIPLQSVDVFASVFRKNSQIHINKTSENGSFIFSLNHLTNNQDIYLSLKPGQAENAEILINNDFSNNYPAINPVPVSLDTSEKRLLEEIYINSQVMEKYKINTIEYNDILSLNSEIFGTPEISITLANYIELNSIREVFNEIIPYVVVRKSKGKYRIIVMNSETNQVYKEPLVLIDNLPVFNNEEIVKIHPTNIKSIDVINKTYVIGDYIFSGVILINTKTNNFAGVKFPDESVFVEYTSITPSVQYISPQYNSEEKLLCRAPDFRNLLYWNPNITLKNDSNTVSFYCSDHCSEYEIIIRGVTKNGTHCFGSSSFTVKN